MPVSEFGRIGRDAELRYTQDGTAVCSVPVAVNYGRKGQDGNRPTQWYEVVFWAKQAEGLAPYLTKGKQIFFTGSELHVETFQKNDGSEGVKLVCRATGIEFASDGQRQAPAASQQQAPAQQAPRQQAAPQQPSAPAYNPKPAGVPQQSPHDDAFDDDIPF